MSLLKILRTKILVTITCIVVGLQIFNISFDPVDNHAGMEDLSINEIESCLELVLEIALNQENAIEETDESDEAPNKPGTSLLLFSFFKPVVLIENQIANTRKQYGTFKNTQTKSLTLSITPPPPKKFV